MRRKRILMHCAYSDSAIGVLTLLLFSSLHLMPALYRNLTHKTFAFPLLVIKVVCLLHFVYFRKCIFYVITQISVSTSPGQIYFHEKK